MPNFYSWPSYKRGENISVLPHSFSSLMSYIANPLQSHYSKIFWDVCVFILLKYLSCDRSVFIFVIQVLVVLVVNTRRFSPFVLCVLRICSLSCIDSCLSKTLFTFNSISIFLISYEVSVVFGGQKI